MPEQSLDAADKADLALEIAHLLFIDVVGYSKLLVNEQIELMQQLNRIVRATECFRDAETSGKLIRLPTGDGMVLLFFRSPEQPVHCALQISDALRDQPHIRLRMGIHSGPVNQVVDVNDQINMAGAGINVGQRVMDCGDAGHILLSNHVAEDLAQYRHWQPYLHDLGECEAKHGLRLHIVNLHKDDVGNAAIPEKLRPLKAGKRTTSNTEPINAPLWTKPWVIVALVLLGFVLVVSALIFSRPGWSPSSGGTPISEKSIAVLPFENRSEEKNNAYFADGVQDEILTRLAKISILKVISRTSTQHYKSTPENLPEIARELGVAFILEGGVQKSSDTVRVNVQLIRAANDSHVWAETYDRKLNDIFSVESDIAKAIADQLRIKLTGEEEQTISAKATENSIAYDEYLRGLAFTLKAGTTPASNLGAQTHLREAVRLDPKFALAWALLAKVDAVSLFTFNFQPTVELVNETRQASETAFSLDPDLREALLARGYYYFACLKDYKSATAFFERARQFLPNDSKAPEALALVTRRRGLWSQSDSYFDDAERLDPRNPSLLTQHALSFVHLRRFSEAIKKLDQVLNVTPDDIDTLALKGSIAQAEGDLARAATFLNTIHATPDHSTALETQAYQALLERRPERMIAPLNAFLLKPDPSLGYINGELRFWLGWLQRASGDEQAARMTWQAACKELEGFFEVQSGNLMLLSDLALTRASLGEKDEALALAAQAAAACPLEKDAVSGPMAIEILARVIALTGDTERATAAVEQLLTLPYDGTLGLSVPLTPALLRLDPMFDSLRNNARFQRLISEHPK